MKELSLLVWVTQLGISVAVPLVGFVWLATWLRDRFGWGQWVIWVGIALGVIMAIDGFVHSLQTLLRLSKDKKKDASPPVSFNDHD